MFLFQRDIVGPFEKKKTRETETEPGGRGDGGSMPALVHLLRVAVI